MTIDTLLEKAVHPQHSRKATDLHNVVLERRIPMLIDFFKKGLSGSEKSEFEKLSVDDQIEKLREKNYAIKPEFVDEFIDSMSLYIMKTHDKEMYKGFKNALDLKKNGKTDEEKALGAERVNYHLTILRENMGFDPFTAKEYGKKDGLSHELWSRLTQKVPELYVGNKQKAYLDLIGSDEAKKKLRDIKGMKHDLVEAQGEDYIKGLLADYHAHSKQNDMEGFKKKYFRHYH